VPASVGLSKLGETKNRINAVAVSDICVVKRVESEPELIVIVADSEIVIVATFEAITLFSAIEKDVPFEKVGAVVSGV
jgi:hypothetical protein